MSRYVIQPYTEPSYDLRFFKKFSPERMKAVALMAEVGLPLYKIHHSIVIGDVALLIADGVEKELGIKVNRYVCEIGACSMTLALARSRKTICRSMLSLERRLQGTPDIVKKSRDVLSCMTLPVLQRNTCREQIFRA